MMRGRRLKTENRKNLKSFFYLSLLSLLMVIIAFFIIIAIYNRKLKNANYSELTAEKIAELVPNETNLELEQASTDIGKSIEEVIKQVEEINEESEKQKNEEKLESKEQPNKKTSSEAVQENLEQIKVKDPEFILPVDGDIARNYAKDFLIYSETLQEWITHLGIDIKAPRTTIVKAAEEGNVIAIKNDPRYGLTIVIEHVNGFKTIYSNLLTTEFVSEGDKVEKGQSIGTVGNSASFEIVDEPHLHFEMMKDDVIVDPNIYLK